MSRYIATSEAYEVVSVSASTEMVLNGVTTDIADCREPRDSSYQCVN